MSERSRQPRGSGAQRSQSAAPVAASRGVMLVAIAALIGLFLIVKGPTGDNVSVAAPGGSSTTQKAAATTAPVATTTTAPVPTTKVPPAQLTITVANGTGTSGKAKTVSDALKAAGYPNSAAVNPTQSPQPETKVYFDAGFEPDAKAVAAKISAGLVTAGRVVARPATVPLKPADSASKIIVLLGSDFNAVSGAAANTPATAVTAATSAVGT